ncbi:ApeA N-terminal domain 1-containing protein [Pseudomonas borbori]
MRVPEDIVRKGMFWKAGCENRKTAGVLTIKNGGMSELELIGSLEEDDLYGVSGEITNSFTVCGQIDNDNFTTLYGCFYKRKSHSLTSGISTSILKSSRALLGIAPVDTDDQFSYKSIYFEMENIESWIDITGFKIIKPHNVDKFLVEYELPPHIEATLPNVGRVKIDFNIGIPFRFISEVNLKQTAAIKIYPEAPMKINDAAVVISKIQHFIIFATQKALPLRNVKAILSEDDSSADEISHIIKWYYESSPFQSDSKNLEKENQLFTLSEVSTNLESYLKNWFSIYQKAQPSLMLYFSVVSGAHKYGESINLSISQAAETYQRKMSGNKNLTFRQRIEEFVCPFSALCDFDIGSFLESTVNTRNYLTHYNENIKNKSASGIDLYFLNKKIQDFMTLNLLKDIGFDFSLIEQISKERNLLSDGFS